MYSASSGSVQPLPTSTWYKYSSWPKDSSTSFRPQFGLYIPHFVLERGGERERWGWVVPVSNYPHIRGNMLKRITCGLARRLTKLYGCWCQPGTDVVCNPPSKSPTHWQPETEVSSWQLDEVQLNEAQLDEVQLVEVQLVVTHVDTVQTFTS